MPVGVFARVQAVLDAHGTSGEKDRKHPHYLKGTIYCGHCRRRFLFTRARGNGGTYEYFMCAGRHNDKNGCPQPYLKAAQAEDAVARYYGATIRHPAERVAKLEEEILVGLAAISAQRERDLARHGRRVEALHAERQKLLRLHYAERIDAEFFGEEQARIGKEITAAKKELAKAELRVDQLKAALEEALRLATDSEYAYRVADDQTRRGWNQDFFKRIYIRDEEVVGAELTDTYAALLSEELVVKLEAFKADRQSKPKAKVTSLRTWGSIEGLIVDQRVRRPNRMARVERLREALVNP